MYTSYEKLLKLNPAKSGAQMHLNGGKRILRTLIREHMDKHEWSASHFSEQARVGRMLVRKLLRGQQQGIRLNKLNAIVRAVGGKTKDVMKQLMYPSDKSAPEKSAKSHSDQLQDMLDTLQLPKQELAAVITIGEDRITVERMPGQETQPVVIEHNGHRLTIAKA